MSKNQRRRNLLHKKAKHLAKLKLKVEQGFETQETYEQEVNRLGMRGKKIPLPGKVHIGSIPTLKEKAADKAASKDNGMPLTAKMVDSKYITEKKEKLEKIKALMDKIRAFDENDNTQLIKLAEVNGADFEDVFKDGKVNIGGITIYSYDDFENVRNKMLRELTDLSIGKGMKSIRKTIEAFQMASQERLNALEEIERTRHISISILKNVGYYEHMLSKADEYQGNITKFAEDLRDAGLLYQSVEEFVKENQNINVKEYLENIIKLTGSFKKDIADMRKRIAEDYNRANIKVDQANLQFQNEVRVWYRDQEFNRAMTIADLLGIMTNEQFATALSNLPIETQRFIIDEVLQPLVDEGRGKEVAENIKNNQAKLAASILEEWERYEDIDKIEQAALNLLEAIYGGNVPAEIKQALAWNLDIDERTAYFDKRENIYYRRR